MSRSRGGQIVDLSPHMTERMRDWYRLGNKLDVRLLRECAYYPKGGCQECSWDSPNPKCNRSHILIDTRLGAFTPKIKLSTTKPKPKKNTLWGVSQEAVLKMFPENVRKEIEEILKKEVK